MVSTLGEVDPPTNYLTVPCTLNQYSFCYVDIPGKRNSNHRCGKTKQRVNTADTASSIQSLLLNLFQYVPI